MWHGDFKVCMFVYFQRGSEELMSHSPMVTTNGTGHSPSQNEVNDAKKVITFVLHWYLVQIYLATSNNQLK